MRQYQYLTSIQLFSIPISQKSQSMWRTDAENWLQAFRLATENALDRANDDVRGMSCCPPMCSLPAVERVERRRPLPVNTRRRVSTGDTVHQDAQLVYVTRWCTGSQWSVSCSAELTWSQVHDKPSSRVKYRPPRFNGGNAESQRAHSYSSHIHELVLVLEWTAARPRTQNERETHYMNTTLLTG